MSLAEVYSRAAVGITAPLVSVEVHLSNGLPSLSMVGLPETEVKESKDRVRSALINSQFEFPAGRITVNLAPAELPKEGGRFDLAIALGILAASGQIPAQRLGEFEFLGELALSGELRPNRGVLPAAIQTGRAGRSLVVASANGAEAALAGDTTVLAADHLLKVCAHLNASDPDSGALQPQLSSARAKRRKAVADLDEVHGQHHAKRALEIAAAGGHSLLMIGPPGTGKTMLASRLPGILPSMTEDEALQVAAVASIGSAHFDAGDWGLRPFRSPHHTASGVALVGGGSNPRPGEISLAHFGVLFLDELPEFDRRVLEVLREPLESGHITISRAARQAEFPAQFQLVAAMNPCPCGYHGDPGGRCQCTAEQVARYRSKISGPLLDRIDMHVEVPRPPQQTLFSSGSDGETSANVRAQVEQARERQLRRDGIANSRLGSKQLQQVCALDHASRALLEQAVSKLGLSPRALHRILRVARTIADLGGSDTLTTAHISEAIGYRKLDRAAPRAVS